jgi:hypothetical protein
MADLWWWQPEALTEARLVGTAGLGSSPRKEQKGEGTPRILTDYTDGWQRGGVGLATRRNNQRWSSLGVEKMEKR